MSLGNNAITHLSKPQPTQDELLATDALPMERAQPQRVAGRVVGNGPWDMDDDTLQLALQRSQKESAQSQPTQSQGLERQVLELSLGQETALQLSRELQMSASEMEMVMERAKLLEELEQQRAASGSHPELALSPFADLPEGAAGDKERRLTKQVRGIVC